MLFRAKHLSLVARTLCDGLQSRDERNRLAFEAVALAALNGLPGSDMARHHRQFLGRRTVGVRTTDARAAVIASVEGRECDRFESEPVAFVA